MYEDNLPKAVVIYNGSGYIKAGFAGVNVPESIFPSVISNTRAQITVNGKDEKKVYIWEEALQHKNIFEVIHPIVKNVIKNFE